MSNLRPIIAPEGYTVTNGIIYSKEIYLGCNDNKENWWLVTDEEAAERIAELYPEPEDLPEPEPAPEEILIDEPIEFSE